jgi:hypothetical protein
MNDGRVVFVPSGAAHVGVFDPNDNSFTASAAHYQNYVAYSGPALLNDGRIVFAPSDATYVGVFDPADDSFTTVVAHD